MAIFSGPKIESNNLLLCLDVNNIKSYVGSGSTWSDAIKKSANVALTGGVTLDTSNNINSFYFDNVDDYANFGVTGLGSTATVEVWAKVGADYFGGMIFGWDKYDIYFLTEGMGYNTGNADGYGIPASEVSSLGLIGNWKHYVFEMRSDVPYTNNKIYINAENQSLSQIRAVEEPANRNFSGGLGRISSWRTNLSYLIEMNCAVFKVYNGALTPDQIKQNYNALKGRFS